MGPTQVSSTEDIKKLRVQADALIGAIRVAEIGNEDAGAGYDNTVYSMAWYQALRAATEAKMWLGKMLEGRGNPFPAELADKASVQ
jgi:hypothetical protein